MFELFTNLPTWFYIACLLLLCGGFAWGFSDVVLRDRPELRGRAADMARAWPLLLLFLITFSIVLCLNPQKAGLAIFGISKLALGGYIGYWCDRLGFRPEDRPHRLEGISKGTAWKRRAIIIAAAILAAALIP